MGRKSGPLRFVIRRNRKGNHYIFEIFTVEGYLLARSRAYFSTLDDVMEVIELIQKECPLALVALWPPREA